MLASGELQGNLCSVCSYLRLAKPMTQALSTPLSTTALHGLKCKECGAEYEPLAIHVCEFCFGPLEVSYDFSRLAITREKIQAGPHSIWRYRDFLPVTTNTPIDVGRA